MESTILRTHKISVGRLHLYTVEQHRFPIGETDHFQVRIWRHADPAFHMQTLATPMVTLSCDQFDTICRVLDAGEAPL